MTYKLGSVFKWRYRTNANSNYHFVILTRNQKREDDKWKLSLMCIDKDDIGNSFYGIETLSCTEITEKELNNLIALEENSDSIIDIHYLPNKTIKLCNKINKKNKKGNKK